MQRILAMGICLVLLGVSAGAGADPVEAAKGKSVADLIKGLKDPDAAKRKDAAMELGAMGPRARTAVPALTAALKDDSEAVRQAAALALGSMGPAANSAVPMLAARMTNIWQR